MIDITHLMNKLARDRPVFHSEADFQHALAWCFHDAIPESKVRLEFKPFPTERMYLDLWLSDIKVAIELKYRTRKLNYEFKGESFALSNQSTQPISRYNFLKDIQRLERLTTQQVACTGYAILLTNDSTYWKKSSKKVTVDEALRLHEGREITGEMAWSKHTGPGTTNNREEPIHLNRSYELNWQDYTNIGVEPHCQFRYLVVQTFC